MRITFIRPSIGGRRASDAMEPLAFAVLKALTPPEVEVRFYDERVAAIPLDEPTDLVAMSVETYTALRAYEIAGRYRSRGIPVVAGGYHPTLQPDEALEYVDAIAEGDAEDTWPRIVDDARMRRLQRRYCALPGLRLEGLRFDRTVFRATSYPPVACVQFSRGCRFACEFCSIHAFYGKGVRARPARDVGNEIAACGRRFVLIVDDNLFTDVTRLTELLDVIEPLDVRWACQISLDVVKHPQVVSRMARAGCIAALIGFESLDERNLATMGKRWHSRLGGYGAAVRCLADHGIMTYGSFVFGYDDDTLGTFEATAEWAIQAGMLLVNFSVLTPMPGTRLLARLREERRMLNDCWWLDPRYRYGDAVFQPRRMTVEQLTEGTLRARRMFYSARSIGRRLVAEPNAASVSHALTFLAGNIISRVELKRKLGNPLGTGVSISRSGHDGASMTSVVRLPVLAADRETSCA